MPAPSTPVQPSDPNQPLAVFGSLTDATRQLTARLDAMLARNPEVEFGQSEGRVGTDPKTVSWSKIETFRSAAFPMAAPFPATEFVSSIYPKAIRVQWTTQALGVSVPSTLQNGLGLLLEFFKDLRGNGSGFGNKPDATMVLEANVLLASQISFVVASGVATNFSQFGFQYLIPLTYRYVRVSLFDLINNRAQAGNLNTLFTGNNAFQLSFLGD